MKQPKETLKSYFETGDKPTEQEFCDFIDSYHHLDSGTIITEVLQDEDGNQTVSLSDSTSFNIQNPENYVDQNNTIRVIDLGDVRVFGGDSEIAIQQAVAQRFNELDENIRTVSETENIIIKADIQLVVES